MPGRILFEDYHALRMVKGPAPAARTRILKTAGVQAHVSRPSRTFTLLCGVRERREPETRGHHPADIGAGLICYSRSRSRLVPPNNGMERIFTQIHGLTAPQTAHNRQIGPEQGSLSRDECALG